MRGGVTQGALLATMKDEWVGAGTYCTAEVPAELRRWISSKVVYEARLTPRRMGREGGQRTGPGRVGKCEEPRLRVGEEKEADAAGTRRRFLVECERGRCSDPPAELYVYLDGYRAAEEPGRPLPVRTELYLPAELRGSHLITFNAFYLDGRIAVGHAVISFD
jgi:hypothetical protein